MTRRVQVGVALLEIAAFAFFLAVTFPAPGCLGGFGHVVEWVGFARCMGMSLPPVQDLTGLYAALAVTVLSGLPGSILVVSGKGRPARSTLAIVGSVWLAFAFVAIVFGPLIGIVATMMRGGWHP